jgi:hypothetical protein
MLLLLLLPPHLKNVLHEWKNVDIRKSELVSTQVGTWKLVQIFLQQHPQTQGTLP